MPGKSIPDSSRRVAVEGASNVGGHAADDGLDVALIVGYHDA